MNELGIEQRHFNAFQGSSIPKVNEFKSFLNDIKSYAAGNNRDSIAIFFSYAWPRENADGEEWHTAFIKEIAIHLKHAGLIINIDQLHSGPGHELNAFMQKIQTSDRVFVFRSKTYDYKISLPISGIVYENNLINDCKAEKSVNHPFIIHVSLSNEYRQEPNSRCSKNAPVCADYLLLLKWLIAEAYCFDSSFDDFWQKKLIVHKIIDNLWNVSHLAPNIIRRSELLKEISETLSKNKILICRGKERSGKTQLLLNFAWENYYYYSCIYWLNVNDLEKIRIKSGSLVIFDDISDNKDIETILSRSDIKIIIITRHLQLFYPNAAVINVAELTPEEAKVLVVKTLGEEKALDYEKLIQLSLIPDELSLACGYIQRNRINISEYVRLYQSDYAALAKFVLKPIREIQQTNLTEPMKSIETTHELSEPKLLQAEKVAFRPLIRPQIAEPLPDCEKNELLRFEDQQLFLKNAGHSQLLEEVPKYALKKKKDISAKAVFISFASPPDTMPKEKWTADFIHAFVNNLRQAGIRVSYQQSSFTDFIKANICQLDNIHVFIIGSRFRDFSNAIKIEDEQIVRCLEIYPQLNRPDRRFIVPILLTSEKHYNKAYDPYAAHSFYELGYAKSLRNLLPFICGFDEGFQNYWVKKSLKYKVDSNWWPHRLPENQDFVGRQGLLEDMQRYFWRNTSLLVLSACYGIGGVGKTQLALKFAHQYGYKYSEIFWFNGESKSALIERYVQLGTDRGIFDPQDKKSTFESRARFVINWMQNVLPEGWLLIIDDALNFEEIKDWIPAKGGKVLITSRHTEWPGHHNIAVDLFTPEEAREYMNKVLIKNAVAHESQAADKLITLLGNLPLAIAQACAYINKTSISIAEYLILYNKKHTELLAENSLSSDQYQKTVAVTWNITLEQMIKEDPDSIELLYCCTHVHHENIPEEFVNCFFIDADEIKQRLKINTAKRIVKEYSMILVDESTRTFKLHSLVQQIIHEQLIIEKKDTDYLVKEAKALLKIYPYSKNQTIDYVLKKVLAPHLKEVLKYLDKDSEALILSKDEESKKSLLDIKLKILIFLADAYGALGNPGEKRVLLERALIMQELHYGKDHIEVATSLRALADAYANLGEFDKEKSLLERSLVIFENYYNKAHTEVALILRDIGCNCGQLGNTNDEIYYLKKALKIQKAHYGKVHIEVAITRGNLANAYGDLGDAPKSKKILENVLKIFETHYGNNHVGVARILINLGHAHGTLGEQLEEKRMLERALAIKEFHYGIGHIETARILTNLGCAYGELGYTDASITILKRALAIKEAHYGKDHVEVARTSMNLGIAYKKAGDVSKSKRLLESALKKIESYYGKDHIGVAITLFELAGVYKTLDDMIGCINSLKRSLPIFELQYGNEHIQVARTLYVLGDSYFLQKNIAQAKYCVELAYNSFIKNPNCGENHPDTQKAKELLDKINHSTFALKNEEGLSGNLFKGIFSQHKPAQVGNPLDKIIMKYKLIDASIASLEKALREAAKYNNTDDLEELINMGCNVNAQDEANQRTALHWAVIEGAKLCIELLLKNKAQYDIPDSEGITAYQYATATNDSDIFNLFLMKKPARIS